MPTSDRLLSIACIATVVSILSIKLQPLLDHICSKECGLQFWADAIAGISGTIAIASALLAIIGIYLRLRNRATVIPGTPTQRAEAFLRSVGKWEESK